MPDVYLSKIIVQMLIDCAWKYLQRTHLINHMVNALCCAHLIDKYYSIDINRLLYNAQSSMRAICGNQIITIWLIWTLNILNVLLRELTSKTPSIDFSHIAVPKNTHMRVAEKVLLIKYFGTKKKLERARSIT